MKPRFRSLLLLLATLVIGIVLGGLLGGILHNKRDKRFHFMRSDEAFVRTLEETIAPADEAQAAAVHALLTEATDGIFTPVRDGFRQSRAAIEQLQVDLATVLTEEQLARVHEKLRRPGRRKDDGKKDEAEKADGE